MVIDQLEKGFETDLAWNHLVPRGFRENLLFRRELREMGGADKAVGDLIWNACRLDPLFFINSFIYVFDAKGKYHPPNKPKQVPFVAFDEQARLLTELASAVNHHKVAIPKSREMAASYSCLMTFLHAYLFFDWHAFLLVSRTEAYVENPRDPKSLFWKIDHMIRYLPEFLTPIITKSHMNRTNEDNGSTFTGESTTKNIGRGGRFAGVCVDEFAAFDPAESFKVLGALVSASECVFYPSTPQGMGNAFYEVCHPKNKKTRIVVFKLRWDGIPFKAAGKYTSDEDGKLELIDLDFWDSSSPERDPHKYEFVLDGQLRSPWYDLEDADCPVKSIRRQELDVVFLGSGDNFFQPSELERIERECADSWFRGELSYDLQTLKPSGFAKQNNGRLKLWCSLDANQSFPLAKSKYVVGCDISFGTGASDTCFVVFDRQTGEQVAEFVTNDITPDEAADIVVVLCRFFKDPGGAPAFLIWEVPGPGYAFGHRVEKTGFRNVYTASDENWTSQKKKTPGWHANQNSVPVMLTNFARAIQTGQMTVRSAELVNECRKFQFMAGNRIVHVGSVTAHDPSGAGQNHGDRVVAAGVALIGWQSLGKTVEKTETERPYNSPGGRRYRRELARRQNHENVWN